MIIFRYIFAEVFKSQFAVFIVLMTIFISQTFVRILADASEGKIPGHLVISIIGLKLPQLAAVILPLSVFLGVLIALGRIYTEQEMSVLKACGISEWYITRIVLVLSFLLLLFSAAITLYFSPMANEFEYQAKENAEADGVLSTLSVGRFQNTGKGDAIVFVHDIDRDKSLMDRVFVAQSSEQGVENVVYANTGQLIEHGDGQKDLILTKGERYHVFVDGNLQKLMFEQYQIQLEEQSVQKRRRNLMAVPSERLLQAEDLESKAELHWRLAIPLSIPILAMIAVPLSAVNPRQGRFGKLIIGLFIFFAYYILLILGKSALEEGKLPIQLGLWWVNILGLITAMLLLAKENKRAIKLRRTFYKYMNRNWKQNV